MDEPQKQNWLAMFEVVNQTNGQVQSEEKLFFQKAPDEEAKLNQISEAEYSKLE